MLSAAERDEVARTIDTIRRALEDLAVRGLRTAGPEQASALGALQAELARVEAPHMAGRLGELVAALGSGEGAALLRAQTSLRVFERVMTLDAVRAALETVVDHDHDHDHDHVAAPRSAMSGDEQKKLLPVLEELARAVEDLVASGLTAASAATRQKIQVSATEAARLKLQRLAPALRYVSEEVERFVKQSPAFSGQRLAFFLSRAWLLLRGTKRAIESGDERALADLLWQRGAAPVPIPSLELVTLGVSKRVVQDVTSAFDFRFRVLADAGPLEAGTPLVWSFLRQLEKNFSADALLHIEQPQGFRPKALLEGKVVTFTRVAATQDRLVLGPPSKASLGAAFEDWDRFFQDWDPSRALARIAGHRPSPLDLEVEMEEEVVLEDYEVGEPGEGFRPDQVVYPVAWRGIVLEAIASTQGEGEELRAGLDALRKKKKKRPPLFGLVHYELGRIVLRPLSTLGKSGPDHLMISDENVDLAELTRAIMRRP